MVTQDQTQRLSAQKWLKASWKSHSKSWKKVQPPRFSKVLILNIIILIVLKETDQEFLELANKISLEDGTTWIVGVLLAGKLTLASIGDSTALLVRNNNVIELTSEHNYSRIDEFRRITDQN